MAAPQKEDFEKRPGHPWRRTPLLPPEASRVAELRQKEAETARTELEARKLTGEIARQPLEKELVEVQIEESIAEIARCRSEAASLDAARFRGDVLLFVFLLMIILTLSLALIDPKSLEAIRGALQWLPS
ncbi:MAG: hypothetical protein JST59_22310 [Actinobacteria bacterium]|nr:hypothetical protein [Actinomycetota bacterium]